MYHSDQNRAVNYQFTSTNCLVAIGIFLLMLGNAISSSTYAQAASELIKIDGLKSNLIYCVMQDSKGYIWAGTDEGLIRLDGSSVRYYSVDDGLPDNDVFKISEDKEGRLWVLSYTGKPAFFYQEKIHTGENTPWLSSVQPKKLAISFLNLPDGSFWYVTGDSAYRINRTTVIERHGLQINDKWNLQAVIYINNKPWLVHNGGIADLIRQKDVFVPFNKAEGIGTTHSKIFYYNKSLFYFSNNTLYDFNVVSGKSKSVYSFDINDPCLVMLQVENSDSLMVTSRKKTIYVSLKRGELISAQASPIEFITGKFSDQEGNVWISSLSDGLYRTKPQSGHIEKIEHPSIQVGLACHKIQKIGQDIFWSYSGGLYMFSENKKLFVDSFPIINKAYKSFKSFARIDNKIWVAMSSYLILKGAKPIVYSVPAKDIIVNKRGMYLAASDGIYFIDRFNDYDKTLKSGDVKKISSFRASNLLSIKDDTLYAAGINGLKLIVNNKEANSRKADLLESRDVKRIIKGANGDIVFAFSGHGIGIIHNDSLYQIDKRSGLLSDYCTSVSMAPNGTYWVSSAKGINHLDLTFRGKELLVKVFKLELLKKGMSIYDAFQTHDSLLIAGSEGAFVYFLNKVNKVNPFSKTIIEGFYANGQLLSHQLPITLDYNKSQIAIDFNRVSFNINQQARYRYKLLPIDTLWRFAENKHVEFPLLPPGRYQFVVSSYIGVEQTYESSASVSFEITPPWWRSGYFIVICSSLIIFISGFFIRRRIKAIENKQLIARKINELETKALRLQMNPHFIFNAINAIKGFYASGNKNDANNYLALFSDLMRLMLETGGQSLISLEKEVEILENFLKLSVYRYNHRFSFSIEKRLQASSAEIQIPILLIQPFVENAVMHGIAPLKEGGKINIVLSQEDNVLNCLIVDNGIGREASSKLKMSKLHNSKGISITEQRLKLHKGSMDIIDLKDAYGSPCGTLINLTIPLT